MRWAFFFLATLYASPPYSAPGSGLCVTFDVPVADPIQGQSSTDYSARRSFLSRYRLRCPVFTQPCWLHELVVLARSLHTHRVLQLPLHSTGARPSSCIESVQGPDRYPFGRFAFVAAMDGLSEIRI